jgi:hypothetical protein
MMYVIDPGTYHIGNQVETSSLKIPLSSGIYLGVVRSNMNIENFFITNGFGITNVSQSNIGLVQTFQHPVHVSKTEKYIQIWSKDGFFLDIDISKHQQLYEDSYEDTYEN